MNFRDMIKDFEAGTVNEDNVDINNEYETEEEFQSDSAKWYNMKDPNTGFRYDIPGLDTLDPGYYYKYVHAMKIKETSPRTFEKILSWD